MTMKFQRLKSSRLSEMIEESIKELILSGELKEGTKMPTEIEMSRQFGVSIVTVREALRSLETIGIIERKRGKNGGTYITSTKVDIAKNAINFFLASKRLSPKHITQVRDILEPASISLAIKNITKEELRQLEDNINYCKKKLHKNRDRLSKRDFFDIADRHTEFHRLIGDATHNPFFSLVTEYILDFLSSLEKDTLLVPDLNYISTTLKNHEEILKYMKSGNSKSAKLYILKDINSIGNHLTSSSKKKIKNSANKLVDSTSGKPARRKNRQQIPGS